MIVALAGCYSPPYTACTITCGPGDACPNGTTCGSDGWCHDRAGEEAEACTDRYLAVTAGERHTCAIRWDRTLWCWGDGADGQLGLGNEAEITGAPLQVGNNRDWMAVTAGGSHTCALRDDGVVLCWGRNDNGQLGDGTRAGRAIPAPVASAVAGEWIAVTAGDAHTCALRADRSMWCWGANQDGQLGDGAVTADRDTPAMVGSGTDWSSVDAGALHTCAIRQAGTLWCWGKGLKGRLGLGSDENQRNEPTRVGEDSDWSQVAPGSDHTCGRRGLDVYCWGSGVGGQLGLGDENDRFVPTKMSAFNDGRADVVAAGRAHTCLISGGRAWCWGKNDDGRVGDGTTTTRLLPVGPGGDPMGQLALGGSHTCSIGSDFLRCWGNNDDGQLGLGPVGRKLEPVQVGADSSWGGVSAGARHTCGLVPVNNRIWCWGENGGGQLGENTTEQLNSPRYGMDGTWERVSAGDGHTCGVKLDGSLWCWGANDRGQAGDGSSEPRHPVPVQVDPGVTWFDVSAGAGRTCGLRADNVVNSNMYCWGDGTSRPLEVNFLDRWAQVSPGDGRSCGIRTVGDAWCWVTVGGATTGQVGPDVDWLALDVGAAHACGMRAGGVATCWGSNAAGQLGDGTGVDSVEPVLVAGTRDWRTLTTAGDHACAIDSAEQLLCWGANDDGQLGDGTRDPHATPDSVIGAGTWLAVDAGERHTCAVRTDGSMWCWGANVNGQLGDGDGGRTIPVLVDR